MPDTYLILGAGISGLTVARRLTQAGHTVSVIDKSRGPGGRMSTRRAGELRFDHGAQYFTARSPEFQSQVNTWLAEDVVRPWTARFADITCGVATPHPVSYPRYIPVPSMSALCRHLATGLNVTYLLRATSASRTPTGWSVATHSEDGSHTHPTLTASRLVVAVPDDQARTLLTPHLTFASSITDPCYAAMVTFPTPLNALLDAAWVHQSPLAWIARENAKPSRPDDPTLGESWVLHASPEWSRQNLELTPEQVAPKLLAALAAALPEVALPTPTHLAAHRWRYSQTSSPVGIPFAATPDRSLSACGDYFLGGKIESAFQSASALATHLVSTMPLD